jgi:predicted enzyme related to lactoylglutathione lyase
MNDRNSKAYQHTKTKKSSNDIIPHAIVWIDVPVRNLERAATFYSFLLNTTLSIETVAGISLVPFPHQDGQPSGCLYEEKEFDSNAKSILVYFNVEGRLDDVLSKIEQKGGKIIQDKEKIGPWGYRAVILDCEKNKIALHSH